MTGRLPIARSLPVQGGDLAVAEWPADGPVVLALHGATSNSRYWQHLADSLPDHRVVAPDLRGRADSHALGGPFGLQQHARDASAILQQLDLRDVVVVGHSLGAFLAPVVSRLSPDRISRMVLIDGGLPVRLPWVMRPPLVRLLVRKEARRALRDWPSVEAYVRGMREKLLGGHPAEAALTAAAMAHDVPADGPCRPRADADGIAHDAVDALYGRALEDALAGLDVPAHLLYATYGKSDRARPFYKPEHVAAWQARLPSLTAERLPGNHATVLFSDDVARRVRAG